MDWQFPLMLSVAVIGILIIALAVAGFVLTLWAGFVVALSRGVQHAKTTLVLGVTLAVVHGLGLLVLGSDAEWLGVLARGSFVLGIGALGVGLGTGFRVGEKSSRAPAVLFGALFAGAALAALLVPQSPIARMVGPRRLSAAPVVEVAAIAERAS